MAAPAFGRPLPAMRLLLTGDCVGGVWTYLLDLAGGLAGRGLDITLAVLGPPPDAEAGAEAGRIPGLTLVATGLPLDWIAAREDDVMQAGSALARLARERGADLVHLHSPAYAAGAVFDAPVVVGCHSCAATWWAAVHGTDLPADLAWRAGLVARGLATADLALAPSRSFARATAAAYRLPAAPAVVFNGRSPLTPAACPDGDLVAFTAGRLWDPGKNLAVLDAAATTAGLPILAAGEHVGPDGSAIALPNLHRLGRISPAGIARHLAARPIFVSTALYEPFGLAVLEAAAAGCPLVLSDIPTFRELWDGAALFVDPRSPDAVASALRRLAGSAARRRDLSDAAKQRSALYGADRMASETLARYREVLDGRLPARSLVA